MSAYRNDLEAARSRIETLEAQLGERDAQLRARADEVRDLKARVRQRLQPQRRWLALASTGLGVVLLFVLGLALLGDARGSMVVYPEAPLQLPSEAPLQLPPETPIEPAPERPIQPDEPPHAARVRNANMRTSQATLRLLNEAGGEHLIGTVAKGEAVMLNKERGEWALVTHVDDRTAITGWTLRALLQ